MSSPTVTTKKVSRAVQHVRLARELCKHFNFSQMGVNVMKYLFDCYLDVHPEDLKIGKLQRVEVASHWAFDELRKLYSLKELEAASAKLRDLYELFKTMLTVAFCQMNDKPNHLQENAKALALQALYEIPAEYKGSLKAGLMKLYFTVYEELDPVVDVFTKSGRNLGREQAAFNKAFGKVLEDEVLAPSLDEEVVREALTAARELILTLKTRKARTTTN